MKLPVGLYSHTAQAVGEKVYVMGGGSVDPVTQRHVHSSQTFVLDFNKSTVEDSVPMKEKRDRATSAVVDKTIFIFGGLGQRAGKSCEKLDTSQLPLNWKRIQSMEEGRTGAGAAAVGGSIYLTGGYDDASRRLSSVMVYNSQQDRWEEGPSMIEARSGHGCVAVGDTVYVAGGQVEGRWLRSVERLLPGAGQWERVADMLLPRDCFGLVTMDGMIYAVGGCINSGFRRGVERFDPERNLWTKMSDLPVAKNGLAAVTVERRQLGQAAQRSYSSARKGELMGRDLARGLVRGEQAQRAVVLPTSGSSAPPSTFRQRFFGCCLL
jgi:N-acetylneuraminic acid mutarotase